MGGITLGLGLLLIASIVLASRGALLLLACYLTYVGIHILIIGLYIYRHARAVSHPRKAVDDLTTTK